MHLAPMAHTFQNFPRFMSTSFVYLWMAILATTFQGLYAARVGPVRVLFLGHNEEELHPSDLYYPMLSQALGRMPFISIM